MVHVLKAIRRWENKSIKIASGSVVKNLPAMQETWVRSLGREEPLEGERTTHSSLLAWVP